MKNYNIFTPLPIDDVKNIPQSSQALEVKASGIQLGDFLAYKSKFFSAWRESTIGQHKGDLLKRFSNTKPTFGEDFAVKTQDWYDGLLDNANIGSLGTLTQKALVVENTYLRAVPTHKPAYYNPTEAGEGYPFDTLQENLLYVGEPVLVSHFSRDTEYALIETNALSYGFVRAKDLVLVSNEEADSYMAMQFGVITQDNLKLSNQSGFIQTLYLGMFLPLKGNVAFIPTKQFGNNLRLVEVVIESACFTLAPLAFTNANIANLINILIGQPYGWGGYLMNRDCAQLLKDYFAVFGVHIPIWSGNQAKVGEVVNLGNLSVQEKFKIIKEKAIPYQTILYRPGHVVLYLGEHNGEIIVLHALWGIKLHDNFNMETRHIVGKTIISTLEYGKELEGYHEKDSLVNLLSCMCTLGLR